MIGLKNFTCLLLSLPLLLAAGCFNGAFYDPRPDRIETPARYRLAFEDIFFESGDGTRLHGWFIPARGEALGTVVHFHGNYGNISYYLGQVYWLAFEKFNVFTFDYRGYGRSGGNPSRHGVYEDGVAAIRAASAKRSPGRDNLLIFGQSLGGDVAIGAVAKNDFPLVRAVAVEGAFSSYRSEARDQMKATVVEKIGHIPCLSLQIDAFSYLAVTNACAADELVGRISPKPLLLIHCLQDKVVSFHHSERLYEKAKEPKDLWLIDGCCHLQVFTDACSGWGYRQRLVRFFTEHLSGR